MTSRIKKTALPPLEEMFEDNNIKHTLFRAYSGDVLYTEGMPISHAYVIKEGEVDLYMVREEKKVIVETLTAGHCFGFAPKLVSKGCRTDNARARTYCEFYIVDSDVLDGLLKKTPWLVENMLRTFCMQNVRSNEVIATRVNFQSDMVVFAQLLNLVGLASLGGQKPAAKGASTPAQARPSIATVFGHARLLLGHSDVHIRDMLAKFLTQHLVQIEEDKFGSKCLIYSPTEIVARTRKLGESDHISDRLEYEYIGVDEFAAIVEMDRNSVLQTLARDELTEDLFTFRKSEVVRLLDEKGKKFFHERKKKTAEEFSDITDIIFADATSIQATLAQTDLAELAKVLSLIEEEEIKKIILGSLPRTRRNELEMEAEGLEVDPVEAALIGVKIINGVRDHMLSRRR